MAGLQIVRGGSGRGAAKSRFGFDFEVNQKDVARVRRKFERASGKSLHASMNRATLATGDLIASRVKQAAPRGATGNLRRSVNARNQRSRGVFGLTIRGGHTTSVLVGPRHAIAPHRHLIIRGHRIVTPGGRFTGRRTAPNPFVDRVSRGFGPKAAALVMREWKDLYR